MVTDHDQSTFNTLAIAAEFGVALMQEVAQQELGTQVLNEQGREGIAQQLLATMHRELSR